MSTSDDDDPFPRTDGRDDGGMFTHRPIQVAPPITKPLPAHDRTILQLHTHPAVVGTPLATPVSGFAAASFLLGLLTIFTLGISGLFAIATGHMAIPETRTGQRAGHGLAVVGLILGYLAVVIWVLGILLVLSGATISSVGISR